MPTSPTPTTVFDALLLGMSQDNNFKFRAEAEHRNKAEQAISVLLAADWNPYAITEGIEIDQSYEYENDIEILATGEESDKNALVAAWGDSMLTVDLLLNEIFNEA